MLLLISRLVEGNKLNPLLSHSIEMSCGWLLMPTLATTIPCDGVVGIEKHTCAFDGNCFSQTARDCLQSLWPNIENGGLVFHLFSHQAVHQPNGHASMEAVYLSASAVNTNQHKLLRPHNRPLPTLESELELGWREERWVWKFDWGLQVQGMGTWPISMVNISPPTSFSSYPCPSWMLSFSSTYCIFHYSLFHSLITKEMMIQRLGFRLRNQSPPTSKTSTIARE